ncbi:MAG TPA: TonB-dependent receptor [Opitutaceae bacterium]
MRFRLVAAMALIGWGAAASLAGAPAERSFADMSLEELMNESVTSVSKKETLLFQSPAAISVVTQEDIRRLGVTSLPEALRWLPGMDVGRISGSQWAVGARGFNYQYSNKLLVLMDGRTVYTPAFGGVFWDQQDAVMADVDRIEVIRGPGATLWGANAVNGVINIITKTAAETQGTMLETSFGTEDRPSVTVRHGGRYGENVFYRAYVKYFERDGLVDAAGNDTPDDWRAFRTGFRLDAGLADDDTFTLQGGYYQSEVGEQFVMTRLEPPFMPTVELENQNRGADLLGRWTRSFSAVSHLSLQAYGEHSVHQGGMTEENRNTGDFALEHRFPLGARHDIVWGAGYRYSRDRIPSSTYLAWMPEQRSIHLANLFMQDQIALLPDRLSLILGSKLEHNDFTGTEHQPGARVLWTPNDRQTVWASAARAVHTPGRYDSDSRLNLSVVQPSSSDLPMVAALIGSPDAESEVLWAYELGYRVELTPRVSLDLASFYNDYSRLVFYQPGAVRYEAEPAPAHLLLPLELTNDAHGETGGIEISAHWRVTDRWRLVADYSHLRMHLHGNEELEGDSPQNQAHVRSYLELPGGWEFNAALGYVGSLVNSGTQWRIPSYVDLDLGLVWRPTRALEMGVWGKHLLDSRRPEFGSPNNPFNLFEQPREFTGRLIWRF